MESNISNSELGTNTVGFGFGVRADGSSGWLGDTRRSESAGEA